jgi:hypothetical protein
MQSFRSDTAIGSVIPPNIDIYPAKYCKLLMNRPVCRVDGDSSGTADSHFNL